MAIQHATDAPLTILHNRGEDKRHQIIPKAMIRDYFFSLGKRNTKETMAMIFGIVSPGEILSEKRGCAVGLQQR